MRVHYPKLRNIVRTISLLNVLLLPKDQTFILYFFYFQLKLLGLLSGGTLTNLDKATLDKKTLHACGHVKGEYYSMA